MERARRIFGGVVLAVAIATTACAGGDDDAAGDTASAQPAATQPTSTAPAPTAADAPSDTSAPVTEIAPDVDPCMGERTDSMPGVTATEIRMGVVTQDVAKLADVGLSIDLGDVRQMFEIFAAEINDAGGVCGRSLAVAEFAQWTPIERGTDQDACVKVTQDTEVAVVFATAGWTADAARCISVAGQRLLISDGEYAQQLFDAAEGRVFTLPPRPELTLAALVDYAEAEGLLDGPVGVFYGTDSAEQGDTVESIVLPALELAGVEVEACRMSASAGGATGTTEVNLCVEQFSSAGVTTVIAGTDVFSMLLAKLEAANVGLDATWIGSTYPANTNVSAGPLLFSSFGGTEAMDGQLGLTSVASFTSPTPNAQSCIETWQAATGLEPINEAQVGAIANVCTMVRQFAAAAARAGVNPTQAGLIQALEGTGTFTLPSGIEGSWGPEKHAAGDQLRVVRFSASAGAYEEVRGFEPLAG